MFHRLFTLIIKELQSLLRERQTRNILILPVVLQVLVFPFAATLDVNHINIAVFNQDNGHSATELIQRLHHASAFSKVEMVYSEHQLRQLIDNQKVLLALRIPDNFSGKIAAKQPVKVQILLDGRNSNSAQIAGGYVQQIVARFNQEKTGQDELASLVYRNWYNPNLYYKWFIVPSLIALITTIGVMIVTSLSVAREREQGTLEQLLVSPLSTAEIFLGKAIPAIIVAVLQATIVFLSSVFGYQIPFHGSLLLFYGAMVLYGLSLIGVGLFISAFCRTQQQAFIGVFVFLMPAILLSGYVAPVENMPPWLQTMVWINPVLHFTAITKMVYLKGASLSVIAPHLWAMLIICLVTTSTAYVIFKRKVS
ncbi:ABC transporter permease [Celerinatantimonas diazotrophica]|uniref:ABC-2 type transport system permease protein n=1 Tax=Celerinatantimonas diazotrophica TaxID=412034 RepID=A0A4R1K124_9GAMM|nr:ABC transporter permease [Celerinatantimonas diazotrophica]TCK57686.1 ABC-2 type transport system permease protein [Celerinatantimonas diazotrophica]CAG9298252.1 putative multidrug ABC transporter permease YbhR [Celerinatantimonas diazotrophica]